MEGGRMGKLLGIINSALQKDVHAFYKETHMNFKSILENSSVSVSVPCRIDLGGTLDISTFFLPLAHFDPATFNIALDMRTRVTLSPWKEGWVKISSKGFDSAEFKADQAPFRHSMGLMFAVVSYFNGHGVHVEIESSSPPRSALGGSSAAAVAMIAAFQTAMDHSVDPAEVALLAHFIESSVAGVPCGMQDQLAAAFGGVNSWHWKMERRGPTFDRESLLDLSNTHMDKGHHKQWGEDDATKYRNDISLNDHILVAYCGIPHVSSDINGRWVNAFLSGKDRDKWKHIIELTHGFVSALKRCNYVEAGSLMNKETRIRMEMTPDVLDEVGRALFTAAGKNGCGARFTGAGGGGCLWAIGEKDAIGMLRKGWEAIVSTSDEAQLLNTHVDLVGIVTDNHSSTER